MRLIKMKKSVFWQLDTESFHFLSLEHDFKFSQSTFIANHLTSFDQAAEGLAKLVKAACKPDQAADYKPDQRLADQAAEGLVDQAAEGLANLVKAACKPGQSKQVKVK